MKGNSEKCHFIASNNETHQILVGNFPIGSSSWEKLLGIKIYLKLTFYNHVQDMQGWENTKSIIQRNTIHENEKKKIFQLLIFSAHSLTVTHWYGYCIAVKIITLWNIFMIVDFG